MALIQTSLIWVAYAVALAILLVIAALFVVIYQDPRERAASASIVCVLTTLCLLATVLLMPVDIALVSSTTDTKWGRKRPWATPDKVDSILFTLKVAYYCLYSVDAVLAILVVTFTYFWHEESEDEEGDVPVSKKLWAAFKYTVLFLLVVVALCLIGIFVPFIKGISQSKDQKLDYFVKLLSENHGERALIGTIGLLISIGSIIYSLYTAAGLALLPVALIKSAPSISAPSLAEDTASQLEQNRERQRQLEARNEGREGGLDSRDKRELEALIREERTLVRRERLAAEARGEGRSLLVRAWSKTAAVFRPVKLVGGVLLVIISLLVWTSMLITAIDKIKNSTCGIKCGYILGHVNIFQPINWIFVKTSKAFPVDYVIFLLLVVLFFASSVVGIATIGIRFLWISLLRIKKGRTSPQALLFATQLLSLILLGINYGIGMIVAPQYTTFGSQTYCDRPARHPGEQPDCTDHTYAIKACSELADNPVATDVCTPSVVSTFLNRVTVNVPFYGAIQFWVQFVFLGVYLIVFVTTLFKTPKLDVSGMDEDLEVDEDEGLLASTGRRFNATWQDITGRARNRERRMGYGTTSTDGRDE